VHSDRIARPRGNSIAVQLSGGYDIAGIDRLVHKLAPILEVENPCRVQLDLRKVIFIAPTALALLTAALKRLLDAGLLQEGAIQMPESDGLASYLSRMDFVRTLAGNGGDDEDDDRGAAAGFQPCRHFATPEDSQEVARALTAVVAEGCSTDDAADFSIQVCLGELTENVIHHAGTDLGGVAAASGWSRSRELEVGIVDLGIGIQASLRTNDRYADIRDDVTAIRTALRQGVTSTPQRNLGIGLTITKMLLRENNGVLLVRSGTGAVRVGAIEDQLAAAVDFPGTIVSFRARTDRPLNIKEIYRRLDHDSGTTGDHASTG
jgi:hypothetical protein